ncbi:hemolysin family protein [Paenibacillus sp. 481]|uniref:hemolysin family protein n=1 Tax=Paenibacillus sp. 481 TaxID=2835869 RepID=UPI001E2AEF23|nr:hemolysin family protein [Paenibacillus sp. 481]UHA74404.1 HlyC/CorC family transporter [Paenibacillus sp. 481]
MIFNLFLVAVLIVLTAFFVATEFAIIKMRPSRVDQLVMEGKNNAIALHKVTSNLDGYLSACQLGITITALGLGWLGEPTVEALLHPLFGWFGFSARINGILSFLIAFVVITFLHVVLGELAPKTLAIQKAEVVSLMFAKPIIWFYNVAYPFIWLLNGSANGIISLFGLKPVHEHENAHSEEEIRIILSESYESGKINKTEFGYVSKIFAFDELSAREIMVPRTDMVCLFTNKSFHENLRTIKREQYTRFPVAEENKDHLIGIVNTKQIFLEYDNNPDFNFRKIIRPALTVSEVMPVKTLLRRMQQEHVQMAILLDEYGGTSGLITMEDILEEIVGEIRDEYDDDETREIIELSEGHYLIDGKAPLGHVNELTGLQFESENVDTIGGWLYSRNSELKAGQPYVLDDMTFTIRRKDRHRIRQLELLIHAKKE